MGAQLTVWETSHEFFFATKDEVTAKSLSDNLLGLEGAFQASTKVLSKLLEARVKEGQLLVEAIELNSYKDKLLFRLVFGKGEDAEEKLEILRKKLKIDNMKPEAVVAVALAGSIVYAAWKLSSDKGDITPPVQIHIENSFNNLGGELGLTRQEAIDLFESALDGDEKVKQNVIKLVRPNGQYGGGEVIIDGKESLTIPREIVDAVPLDYEKPQAREVVDTLENVEIVVRALDLDQPEKGWWGIIPKISDRRISLALDAGIDPATIPAGRYFRADVEVEFRYDKMGRKKPKKILLKAKRQ